MILIWIHLRDEYRENAANHIYVFKNFLRDPGPLLSDDLVSLTEVRRGGEKFEIT